MRSDAASEPCGARIVQNLDRIVDQVPVVIEDKNEPESFSLRVEGKGVPGWVKGTAKLQISPNAEGSELQCDSEGQVGGVIAAVGSRLVEAVGKKMQDEFFRKLGEQLGG